MMSREWVKDTREAWARAANEALRQERDGLIERIKDALPGGSRGSIGSFRRSRGSSGTLYGQ